MTTQELSNIDDYEVFLADRLSLWSPMQRVALAASVAEHWLPAYQSFSAEEQWGDGAALSRALDAVWRHVQGTAMTEREAARHAKLIDDVTPHMDDFDAEEALIACCVLRDTLRVAANADNSIPYAMSALLGVFEGLVEEWPIDPASESRVWQKSAVRKELKTQLKLIDEIDAIATFDPATIEALRERIGKLKSKRPARPKPEAPTGLTNQTAFEQYRRYVESDLRGQVKGQPEPPPGDYLFGITYLGYWMGRYSRRMQTINGSYGRLADEPGHRALVARNRARDAAAQGSPNWDRPVYEVFEMCLQNNSMLNVLDADSVRTPHSYGPSLRQLWLDGRRRGGSDEHGWSHIRAWASHRPVAWESEDQRRNKGQAHPSTDLGEKLAQVISWRSTGNPFHPWATEVAGTAWQVRINDFPDELMYSLIIDGENVGDFHDWPGTWQRPGR